MPYIEIKYSQGEKDYWNELQRGSGYKIILPITLLRREQGTRQGTIKKGKSPRVLESTFEVAL